MLKTLLRNILLSLLVLATGTVQAQNLIDIYPGAIPGGKSELPLPTAEGLRVPFVRAVTRPSLELFSPAAGKVSGTAVIIFPGGGYAGLAYQSEGVRTAEEFARNGVTAFVLNYRLPDDALMQDKEFAPLQDAQQALKLVREQADNWGIDAERVGIMGFSAGGHLASTFATRYSMPRIDVPEGLSLRPDFQILIYPVISMKESLTHAGSRLKLLGASPSAEQVGYFSSELQVTADAPPAYITHAGDDVDVDVDNSILYYEALRHQKVATELHLFPYGGHGFVLPQPPEEWMAPLLLWMKNSGWL